MENIKTKIYIIGNGFDCYGHHLKTQYADFAKYLKKRYPNYKKNFDGELSTTQMPDGGEEYDMNDVVGAVIRVLDECAGNQWNCLETSLSEDYIRMIVAANGWLFKELNIPNQKDDDIFHDIHDNEDMSVNLSGGFMQLKKLFIEWVEEDLGTINYAKVIPISTPSFENSLFLNFNYTETLEKVYAVAPENICHIHGKWDSSADEIFFGHGGIEPVNVESRFWGIQDAFDFLWHELKKDTTGAMELHKNFFEALGDVEHIYSYGFSFSDVDMVYINRICKMVDLSSVVWHFNKYDWENKKDCINKINALGFTVCKENVW